MTARRVFAVIPAAGHSRRMGFPKLLLQIEGEPLIRRLIRHLVDPSLTAVYIVVRQADDTLFEVISTTPAMAIRAADSPPDMKASVRLALEHIQKTQSPDEQDAWLLIPADHPEVEQQTLQAILQAGASSPDDVIVPKFQGRRGHPTLFPWKLARWVSQLNVEQGINSLLQRPDVKVREIRCEAPSILWDLDAPEDVERYRSQREDR